ncbi:5'-methylthioadenosine/adenosylhomocysteine nucleosidase [Paenibacillus sp. ACRRX]|uniref:5'-methylthioadenosine/adenosylhomocysteine nucleosidase n=1 Tax=unclassified Paenibacillus TaxID=185978 RepID=UPI001EF65800|nr:MULTISPECIES: 5'-methylthioadenosine/adenosylhomocysteine nucleosidase [unclassified Paenibacillus]MCG7407637.1 5'-methylthioadenosine/adenosylhomocysteine nucleosidase [Paenibacillus sp. ACRRX]MDK8180872.1 5'-methylthioadenosine/adenosylhomocysteine nucleosidase [Paenibacillus sp. UMB4589-SE434]
MTIGIIGAMDEEIALLLTAVSDMQEETQAGNRYYKGLLHGHQVVICKSGVGKVNAAITTQVLIDRYQVTQILFTGVAGAVNPNLNIGDIVISSACIQHDMDVTALGFKPGEIPYQACSTFTADAQLIRLAESACANRFAGRYMKGIVLSGDQFIASREKVRALFETFEGACTEMEGAAVAQACMLNHVPFVIIRSMSDKADGSAHVNFAEFTVTASEHSFQIIESILLELQAAI